jgi:hypothetical protein
MTMADPLYFFGVTVADNEELQAAFRGCQSLREMLALMRCEGLDLNREQLRKFASRHDEPWWPWAGQSPAWKEAFFRSADGGGPLGLLTPLMELLGMGQPRQGSAGRRGLA